MYMAFARAFEVAVQRVVSVLPVEFLSFLKLLDDGNQVVDVKAASLCQCDILFIPRRCEQTIEHTFSP